jgi:TPR repeat protein
MRINMSPESTDSDFWRMTRLLTRADQGDSVAACLIGDRCREGRVGVQYSPRRAFYWYAQSALAGNPDGQSNLGVCYEAGFGCPQNDASAFKWYRQAAAQKSPTGTFNLGLCYLNGRGVPVDRAEALAWFQSALALGHEPAREKVESLAGEISPMLPVPDGEATMNEPFLKDITVERLGQAIFLLSPGIAAKLPDLGA